MSVYSTRFVHANVHTAGDATAAGYVVPAGKVAVVRSIDCTMFVAGTFLIGRIVAGSAIAIVSTQGIVALWSRQWRGDQVFNAGETIGIQRLDGDGHVSVSGFLLNL